MRRIRDVFLGAGCFFLLLFSGDACASQLVIGGNSTNIGTIITISPKTTDTESTLGSALLNTIAGITDADSDNPYLIKLGPGTYNVGSSGLVMKQWVSLEGSGEAITKIKGSVSVGNFPPTSGAVNGADNAEIRFLTVENAGAGNYTAAILNYNASPSITHVTAKATGPSGAGSVYGIANFNSSPLLTHVTASGLNGSQAFGIYTCTGSPRMTHVKALASGAETAYALQLSTSSALMEDVTAEANGTSSSYGMMTLSSSTPIIRNSSLSASGGSFNVGIYMTSTSLDLYRVGVSASGGQQAFSPGIMTGTSGTVRINHSTISGTTNSIVNGTGVTTRIGASQLSGGPVTNSGTLTCAGVYDENYAFSQSTCP